MDSLVLAGLSTNQGATATLAELLAIQLEEKREQIRLKKISDEQDRKVRKEGADAANREHKQMLAKQAVCTHKADNSQPRTGGVRSWSGQMSISCNECHKVWEGTESELRNGELALKGLFPRPERITGPILS